jgi:hypothetical protein
MFPRIGRSRLPLIGAGFLVLLSLASFLILDLGGSVSPSALPVIDLGQGQGAQGATGASSPGTTVMQPDHDGDPPVTDGATTTSKLPDVSPTGTTMHETVHGGVYTGGTGRGDGGNPEPSGTTEETDPPDDDY